MYQRGELTRQKVLSPAYVAGTASEPSPILRAFYDYTIRGAWGGVWSRPGLDLKYRSLLSICSLAVLNRPYELKIQLRGAVNLDALKILDEVVTDIRAEGTELEVPE